MFVMSGKTPVTEGNRFGARTVLIGWGQEIFDLLGLDTGHSNSVALRSAANILQPFM